MNLLQLENVENELQFESYTNEDVLNLGMTLVNYANENNKAVAIHIERNRVPIFTHLMDGTSEENVFWLYRKKPIY
ncbi:heme-binding protein [Peribacillus simplex]